MYSWRIWKHEDDSLGTRLLAANTSCDCLQLTEGDFLYGGLFFVMDAATPFSEMDITIEVPGIYTILNAPCQPDIVPAAPFTMDESEGRMASDSCHPVCGPANRCQGISSAGAMYTFHCTCLTGLCQDVGFHVPSKVFLYTNKTMQICHPFQIT